MNLYVFVLLALIFTILIEFIVYSLFIRKDYGKLFLYSVLINAFTNPLANLSSAYMNIFLIEFFVVIVEIFLIKSLFEIKYWKAILISLIANIISLVLGFFFFQFF
ncbi:MAG: hypothetical protein AABW67_01955 [Nanoarchaeota archaeon]